VLRTAGIGSVGPFFAITTAPVVGRDPASDTTDWVYCCGTPTLGYTPFATSGSLPTSFATSSNTTLMSYTFNADDAQTISSLSVSITGLAGSISCSGTSDCKNQGDSSATGNCSGGNGGHPFICPVAPAALTVTLSRNMVVIATGTINPDGSFTLVPDSFSVTFNAGDTLTLKLTNPSSTVTDTIASGGTWSL
jgi:hypothetical protein